MVEHSAVNRVVVGSSPTRGALKVTTFYKGGHFYKLKGNLFIPELIIKKYFRHTKARSVSFEHTLETYNQI